MPWFRKPGVYMTRPTLPVESGIKCQQKLHIKFLLNCLLEQARQANSETGPSGSPADPLSLNNIEELRALNSVKVF